MKPKLPYTSPRTGRLVCYECKAALASEVDNLCTTCRSKGHKGFITAWVLKQAIAKAKATGDLK
jgi:phosphopantetheinyl transferase